jgi:hypothetical protein
LRNRNGAVIQPGSRRGIDLAARSERPPRSMAGRLASAVCHQVPRLRGARECIANRSSEPVHVRGRDVGPIDSPECLFSDHLPFGIRSDTLLETFFTREVIMSKRDDLSSYRLALSTTRGDP